MRISSSSKGRCDLQTANQTVRVKVPAAFLFDFDKMSQVLKKTLVELGHGACCSGFDIRFEVETNFVVDSKLNIKPGN
jgi:hypothetical protein